ncbi:Structural maintenance of chromosomes 5 [Chlorella sorokiniana]|uniref:Structural maintenance of chromosomes protein 5 n=1 Tax=Chlorella sorokiniana TaxID=3076 RepID=A0A2P6TIW2_CHLSO|nr:Structural maintenance of chromosomes 5 [Chlorella sorokiniana]|eukprot:PRW39176.1 Structural maintenance of chromosomes 5 [Chlorella sorokiniana]
MDDSGSRPRPFKRQRVEQYKRGSVMRVEVQNFMTYKHAVIEPGPKLNLVLGPNGTGKSSLVCAICVGLAGRTNLLGRAEDVSSFVRKGSQSGWVEITLSSGDPMRPHKVRREINARDNHSTWHLNGRECRMKDVEELARQRLKVQLENLCQFLPQDKVVEFARMKPVDLLEATEKAIGNGELFEQHKQLIDVRKQLADHDHHKEALEASLQGLRDENARNTRDVQNLRRRDELLEQVRLAQGKLPWLQFEEKRVEWQAEKQVLNQQKRDLQQFEQKREENEGPLAERQALLERLQRDKKRLEREVRETDAKLSGDGGLEDRVLKAVEEANGKEEEIRNLERQAAERERRTAELERDVEELGAQVAALPPVGDQGELGQRRGELLREHRDVSAQDGSIGSQLVELRGEAEALQRTRQQSIDTLRRIDSSKHQRLMALNNRHNGILEAHRWLQANRARFRGHVYGPIAVELECPDQQHLKYLEQQIGGHLAFFVTQFSEDQDLLIEELKNLNFRPSIANFTDDPNTPIQHPQGEPTQYARYGVSQTLDQVFTAPAVVKKVLCDLVMINQAYVGDSRTQVEQLLAECPRIANLYTPQANYRRTRSKYNAAAESTQVSDIRPARLLGGNGGAADGAERTEAQAMIQRCDQELQSLDGQLKEVQAAKAEKEAQLRGIKAQIAEIDKQIKAAAQKGTSLRTRLKTKQGELERLRNQPDPRKREPKLRREMAAAQERAFTLALEFAQVQASMAEKMAQFAAVDLGAREAHMQCEVMKEASRARQQRFQRMKDLVAQLDRHVKQLAEVARAAKARAEELAPNLEELKEQWDAAGLPEDREALTAYMEERQMEADAMMIANPAALRQYNERCKQIAEQEHQLETLEEQRQLARDTLDTVSGEWLPRLKEIVEQVSETFSQNFMSVGCAGEVVLHEAPGEDYEKYAIEIRVKFRDSEELQTLDANRQSGGERSVSTILYLIALQGVTVTPFRVVDEINQGMDPINERKVFMQLVDAACREGTPQCFLLTPKLLPDLPFSKDVTVLQIMNGGHVQEVATNFSMEKLLGRQRMQVLSATA